MLMQCPASRLAARRSADQRGNQEGRTLRGWSPEEHITFVSFDVHRDAATAAWRFFFLGRGDKLLPNSGTSVIRLTKFAEGNPTYFGQM